MEIEEILEKLFGKIQPVGETREDEKRFENIENYEKALTFIVKELQEASLSKDRVEGSMKEIGKKCFDILYDYNLAEE